MVQVFCFSAEVIVETPVASREMTSPKSGQRALLSLSISHSIFEDLRPPLNLLRGVMGHEAREPLKEASDKPRHYSLQLSFVNVGVGWE